MADASTDNTDNTDSGSDNSANATYTIPFQSENGTNYNIDYSSGTPVVLDQAGNPVDGATFDTNTGNINFTDGSGNVLSSIGNIASQAGSATANFLKNNGSTIAGLTSAGASLYGSQAQLQAANNALALQNSMYNQNKATQQPWVNAGTAAVNNMSNNTANFAPASAAPGSALANAVSNTPNLNSAPVVNAQNYLQNGNANQSGNANQNGSATQQGFNYDSSSYLNSPLYKSLLQSGIDSTQAAAAAGGSIGSGNQLAALQKTGMAIGAQYENQDYSQQLQNWSGNNQAALTNQNQSNAANLQNLNSMNQANMSNLNAGNAATQTNYSNAAAQQQQQIQQMMQMYGLTSNAATQLWNAQNSNANSLWNQQASLAGLGQTSAGSVGSAGTAYGTQAASQYNNTGNALAAGATGIANGVNSAMLGTGANTNSLLNTSSNV